MSITMIMGVLTFVLALMGTFSPALAYASEKIFRLHLSAEPLSIDPAKQKGSGGLFLMNSICAPLFKSDLNQVYQPSILSQCRWLDKQKLSCDMAPNLQWSNGQPITAHHVQKTFEYFMNPLTPMSHPELIQNIKAVQASSLNRVIFNLIKEDPRFMEQLTSPLLCPIFDTQFPAKDRMNTLVTSGPYKIEKWVSKNKITLTPNTYYRGHAERPKVEFLIIPEESTALLLYENNQLDFLRRVPTSYISQYKNSAELYQIPLMRFDYIGFGPALLKEDRLREQLALSLDYNQWGQFMQAMGRPGCFGIAKSLVDSDPCLNYSPTQFEMWKKEIHTRPHTPDLTLHFSTLGGSEHQKSMEWVQNQWKKNLNLHINIKGVENSLFQKELREGPPPLFRLGVPINHLSCYNALESFFHSTTFSTLPFKQKSFEDKLQKLRNATKSKGTESALCHSILNDLIRQYWIIPLGRIHSSILVKSYWKGWKLTSLNVLDLSELHYQK